MSGALLRYRVLAWTVGTGLLVLVLVAMPLKYAFGHPFLVKVVGPLHGFLYMGYVVLAGDLGFRCRWPILRTLAVMLAGTVPFLSFVAERNTTRDVQARLRH